MKLGAWHKNKIVLGKEKKLVIFIFLPKKNRFSGIFSTFYGQRSVTAAWATPSPWSNVICCHTLVVTLVVTQHTPNVCLLTAPQVSILLFML